MLLGGLPVAMFLFINRNLVVAIRHIEEQIFWAATLFAVIAAPAAFWACATEFVRMMLRLLDSQDDLPLIVRDGDVKTSRP